MMCSRPEWREHQSLLAALLKTDEVEADEITVTYSLLDNPDAGIQRQARDAYAASPLAAAKENVAEIDSWLEGR